MNILIMVLGTFASLGCLAIVVTDIVYEEPAMDAPDYVHNALGMLISVGSLAVPALVVKLIIDLF